MSEKQLIRIGELSKRAGLTIRALRYYEEIGLLQPAARTESGYRLYDEGVLYLLTMIKRMKLLGLPLVALGELQAIHRDERNCAPVRQRFLAMLDEQVRRIDQQMVELQALRSDLIAYAQRSRERTGGPDVQEERCEEIPRSGRTAPLRGAKPDADQDHPTRAPYEVSVLRR